MHKGHRIDQFNERIALLGTQAFGTMWACWLFMALGMSAMMPWLPHSYREMVLLVSSAWIQLWALPLLAVGSSVQHRASERRAKQDHEAIKAELALIREDHTMLMAELVLMQESISLLERMDEKLDAMQAIIELWRNESGTSPSLTAPPARKSSPSMSTTSGPSSGG